MLNLVKVFRFQRKTLYWFCCLFLLLRSSVSTEDLIVILRFLFLYYYYYFFLTRFLQNAWTDFHEIFRDGVYWSRKTENNFSCDDVTSGPSYWRFSDFEGVILWRYLLRNDSRYLLQIFTDDRQRSEVYTLWSISL